MKIPENYVNRRAEITELFLKVMNRSMDAFMDGSIDEMYSLKKIASEMYLHPVHITNVVKLHTGFHPCHFYELRILEEAKKLLADNKFSITDIANRLAYDKSNFTKWFKRYQGITPTVYRQQFLT
jgi:AraC-like DNA-binding protein